MKQVQHPVIVAANVVLGLLSMASLGIGFWRDSTLILGVAVFFLVVLWICYAIAFHQANSNIDTLTTEKTTAESETRRADSDQRETALMLRGSQKTVAHLEAQIAQAPQYPALHIPGAIDNTHLSSASVEWTGTGAIIKQELISKSDEPKKL